MIHYIASTPKNIEILQLSVNALAIFIKFALGLSEEQRLLVLSLIEHPRLKKKYIKKERIE